MTVRKITRRILYGILCIFLVLCMVTLLIFIFPVTFKKESGLTLTATDIHYDELGDSWFHEETIDNSSSSSIFYEIYDSELSALDYLRVNKQKDDFKEYAVSIKFKNDTERTFGYFSVKSKTNRDIVVANSLRNNDIIYIAPNSEDSVGVTVYARNSVDEQSVIDFCKENIEFTYIDITHAPETGYLTYLLLVLKSKTFCYSIPINQ